MNDNEDTNELVFTKVTFQDTNVWARTETLAAFDRWLDIELADLNNQRKSEGLDAIEHPLGGWKNNQRRQYITYENREALIEKLSLMASVNAPSPPTGDERIDKLVMQLARDFEELVRQLDSQQKNDHIILELN